jgi:urea transport system ATP-binding protein
MGRNGAGKTTTMKAIMGILKARTGHITFDGNVMDKWSTGQRSRAGISYVPQGRGIFPYLTVYENLLMGFESSPGNKLDNEALEEQYELFPILKTMRKRMAGTLSGGQQQQLALARALVCRPKVLLLDEPTEGIQPSIIYEIESLLISLSQADEISILVVEQFFDFARAVADQFYIMETGQIVESGPIAEFTDDIAKTYLAV